MNNTPSSPFHRFQGRRFIVLIAVFAVYTSWYVGPGFFGDMLRIPGHISLQEKGFYSGAEAVEILSRLDSEGRKTKFLALIFDVPYMILQALVFEAAIAFGLRHMALKNPKWNLLFILPIAFLLTDFAEDSFIALTLTTGSTVLGAIAGVMTALKFATFIPAVIVSLIMLSSGIWAWLRETKRIKTQ
ncbi:hypothetical protein [Hellea balneolensis]|uniref:hypothetical protein n=1 Tax=Hellea balneolensis TaxID=287478 RepID=UPI0003F5EC03|nr:hypothetical protein [Hellea balneolensis]